MQQANGRNRVVAYANNLLAGSQKNWINKVDGMSEIELDSISLPSSTQPHARPGVEITIYMLQPDHHPTLTDRSLKVRRYGDPEPVMTDVLETMSETEADDDFSDEETKEGEEEEVPPWESRVDPVDEFRLDSEQFVVEQHSVSWIKVLCAFLKDGAIPMDSFLRTQIVKMAPRYKVEEGVLKRRVNLPARVGHTLERVRQQAFWPGWRKDVNESAIIAVLIKGLARGDLAFLAGGGRRCGASRVAERCNKYILVFGDYFTRWAEAFAVKWLDTVTFVETLVNGVVSRHGIPSCLLSDRSSNFISDLAKSFYETLAIK
ncbi:Integrase, catalytic core protein [Phytophthora megakarya]|uniref:Integrase, catalytic core protein n=1 Tax=Phytophthora megakarya TaxID=4795 RepID=A0A225UXZ4_9STRA|nr:Integrase, catalytic core protein [Phytophthora megakarya]